MILDFTSNKYEMYIQRKRYVYEQLEEKAIQFTGRQW